MTKGLWKRLFSKKQTTADWIRRMEKNKLPVSSRSYQKALMEDSKFISGTDPYDENGSRSRGAVVIDLKTISHETL